MRKIVVTEEDAGMRADILVAQTYPEFSRSALKRLFTEDLVSIHDAPIKAGHKVKLGETLVIDDRLLKVKPGEIDLPIIYEDDDVVVVNKPVGVLTHSKGALNEEATVATFILPKLNKDMAGNRAGIVHRLDRATSGVIICAKTLEAMSWLQKQFAQRRTKKTYIAIVKGRVEPEEALIDIPIERNPKDPKTFRPGANGKPAQTAYKVLKQIDDYALVELKPVTGRTHQLRVHLQHLHHPIVGDNLYGGETASRMFLHAASLEITLPNRTRKVYSAELPQAFKDFMEVGNASDTRLASPDK